MHPCSKVSMRRATMAMAAAGSATLMAVTAQAGGAIGWAEAVNQFSTEGTAVGAAAVVLGILAVGAILMFGITGMITTVVMVCLGGALMAKAASIGAALFGAGAGGGSILATTYAVEHQAKLPSPVLIIRR